MVVPLRSQFSFNVLRRCPYVGFQRLLLINALASAQLLDRREPGSNPHEREVAHSRMCPCGQAPGKCATRNFVYREFKVTAHANSVTSPLGELHFSQS